MNFLDAAKRYNTGKSLLNESTNWFTVKLNGKEIDSIQSTQTTAEEVKKSLIDHDGYDPDIVVTKDRVKKVLKEDDEHAEDEASHTVVEYEEIDSDIAKICDYIITEVKQLGVGIQETKQGAGIFDRDWFKNEMKEINKKLTELNIMHQTEINKD
jgi:type III secretory pathway component EscV